MTIFIFIKSTMVNHLKWLNLSINNEKLINLEDIGLLLLLFWILMALIEWFYLVLVLL